MTVHQFPTVQKTRPSSNLKMVYIFHLQLLEIFNLRQWNLYPRGIIGQGIKTNVKRRKIPAKKDYF